MCNATSRGPETERCSSIVENLTAHVFSNVEVLNCLAKRYKGLFRNQSRKGAWLFCVNADEPTVLAEGELIYDALLSGVPFAAEFTGRAVSSGTSKLKHASHTDDTPLGVHWQRDALFMEFSEIEAIRARTEETARDEKKTMHIEAHVAPLVRLLLHDEWPTLQELFRMCDLVSSNVVIFGALSATHTHAYHARAMVARYAAPTTYENDGEWEFRQITMLLVEYMRITGVNCDVLNRKMARRVLVARKKAIDVGEDPTQVRMPPLVLLENVDDAITRQFSDLAACNAWLGDMTPMKLKRIIVPQTGDPRVRVMCSECGVAGGGDDDEQTAVKRCEACHLFYYCSKECQRKHWTRADADGHRFLCPMARAFVATICQLPVARMTVEMFNACLANAVQTASVYAENTYLTRIQKSQAVQTLPDTLPDDDDDDVTRGVESLTIENDPKNEE